MKIMAVCGSPRKHGNTARLLNEVVAGAKRGGADAEIMYLTDYDIRQCDGCLVCEGAGCSGTCSIADDMQGQVIPAMLQADAIVLGTPSYFDLPTGLMKVFMDRTNMAMTSIAARRLLFATVIVGQSEPASLSAVHDALSRYCDILEMRPFPGNTVQVIAREPGEVGGQRAALKAAQALGKSLCSAARTTATD